MPDHILLLFTLKIIKPSTDIKTQSDTFALTCLDASY